MKARDYLSREVVSELACFGTISALFRIIVGGRRQPCPLRCTKNHSKFCPFRSQNFDGADFCIGKAQNAANTSRIGEYFNTAEVKIDPSKSGSDAPSLLKFCGVINLKSHRKKMIAPIVVSVIMVLYYVVYFGFLIILLEGIWKYLLGIIPLVFSIIMVKVCIERINEIKRGEEDDLSQY